MEASIVTPDEKRASTFDLGSLHPLNDVEQVARYLHCGRTQVFALIKSGELLSVKVGRRRLIPASAVLSYLEAISRPLRT